MADGFYRFSLEDYDRWKEVFDADGVNRERASGGGDFPQPGQSQRVGRADRSEDDHRSEGTHQHRDESGHGPLHDDDGEGRIEHHRLIQHVGTGRPHRPPCSRLSTGTHEGDNAGNR